MKSANELAATFSTSPEEQKRQAVALRRLAGGVRAAAARKESTGLTDKEVKALLNAVAVLDALATAHSKAQKLAQQSRDAQEAAERAVRAEMKANFDKLETVPDKVALIAAVSGYVLRGRLIATLSDMHYHFMDSINGLSYSLSKKVAAGRSAQDVVTEAWASFEAGRADLREKHAEQIRLLALAAEGAQQRTGRL
jgi:hypothetical protein